jgi:glycosyltransferase involved in cell wall biosynthesis
MKLLYIGRFAEQKNNLALLGIINELILMSVDKDGIAIKHKFLDLAQKYLSKVKYHGFQPNNIIFKNEYHFLLLPSFWEGFPVVMLEAAHRSVIPVCSDILTGPREFISNIKSYDTKINYPFIGCGGVLMKCPVNFQDYLDWAKLLKMTFDDKNYFETLKKIVFDHSNKFSFEQYKISWENCLDNFI